MLLRGQLKNVGYQWRLIEDKKILSFCNNDEFLNDPNSPIVTLEKKEENENKEKINEDNNNKENKENDTKKDTEIKIIKVEKEDKDKDEMIQLLQTKLKTERELVQLIIDELNEKLDKKEKENMQLLMTISQLKKSVDPKIIEKIIPESQNIKTENIKFDENKINEINNKENLNISLPSFDLSQFEKEKNELQFEIEKKNSEIKQIEKEKEKVEEQNIFISKENHQLRQKISELKLQLEILQSSSSSSLLSLNNEQEFDIKKKFQKNRDKTPESKKSSQIRNTFGVTLKKVAGGGKNIDYILQAQEENIRRQKEAEILFKNSELYQSLHKNVIEYDSPQTVSSNSDILEIDMPELNFANNNNDEEFKKVEEELYSKEMQHLKAKKEKQKKV